MTAIGPEGFEHRIDSPTPGFSALQGVCRLLDKAEGMRPVEFHERWKRVNRAAGVFSIKILDVGAERADWPTAVDELMRLVSSAWTAASPSREMLLQGLRARILETLAEMAGEG